MTAPTPDTTPPEHPHRDTLASHAYRLLVTDRANEIPGGHPLPTWDDLPYDADRETWRRAADAWAVVLAVHHADTTALLVTGDTTAAEMNAALAQGRPLWWAPDPHADNVVTPGPLPAEWQSVGWTTDDPPLAPAATRDVATGVRRPAHWHRLTKGDVL